MIKTFSEMSKLKTFEERYRYLKLTAIVGEPTFGSKRYLNQRLYRSPEWKRVKEKVIIRDDGCDLGMPGYEISGRIYIHHMNPLLKEDLLNMNFEKIFDLENLVCVSYNTHEAIHFGDESLLPKLPIERKPGDTKLW